MYSVIHHPFIKVLTKLVNVKRNPNTSWYIFVYFYFNLLKLKIITHKQCKQKPIEVDVWESKKE